MKARFFPLALALGVILLSPAWAQAATLSVNANAALEGAFGMEIGYDGTTQQVFVQDNTPESEPTYNFEFRHNFNNIFIPDLATQSIMLVRSDTPRNDVRVFMWCRNGDCGQGGAGGQFNLMFQVRMDSGEGPPPWQHCARLSAGPFANVLWRVELAKGTGSNDGICRVYRNGLLLVDRQDMPDDFDLDAHRWGGLAAVDTAISGSTYNDSFVSTR